MKERPREQMPADLLFYGAMPRTQEACPREAEELAKHFNRSPAKREEKECKAYLLYLVKEM